MFVNRTDGIFSAEDNQMITLLHNSAGVEVLNQEVNDSIYIAADTLVMPIPEFHLIPNPSAPNNIVINAIVDAGSGNIYYDILESTLFSKNIGFNTSSTTIISSGAIMIICLMVSKEKKRK